MEDERAQLGFDLEAAGDVEGEGGATPDAGQETENPLPPLDAVSLIEQVVEAGVTVGTKRRAISKGKVLVAAQALALRLGEVVPLTFDDLSSCSPLLLNTLVERWELREVTQR